MPTDATNWDDLTKVEATEIFERHVDEHPARVAAFVDDAIERGVDPADLDFSRASLERVWPVVVRSAPPAPETPEELRRDELPIWAAFRLSYAQRIGRRRVELATGVAAYFAECVLRAEPENRWVLGDVKGQEGFRQPLLAFAGGAQVATESLVATTLTRALDDGDRHHAQSVAPSGLRRLFDLRMRIDLDTPLDEPTGASVPATEAVGDEDVFEVHDEGAGSFHVTVNPEVDDQLSGRVDRLVERLGSSDGVDRVVREDRDVVLVAAPTLDRDAIVAALASAWQATAPE